MNETVENVEFVEDVLASALNAALRDLAGRGTNLWVWEGRKPNKITVQKPLDRYATLSTEGFAAPVTEDYVWQVKSYAQRVDEALANESYRFRLFVENITNTLFNKLELTDDTVIFSAYPVFELLRVDPLVWARMYLRLKYLNVPVEIAHQLARTNDKIKPLDLDAPLAHRK